MVPGQLIYYTIGRQTIAGAASAGKTLAGDWNIAVYLDGVLQSVATSIVGDIGANGAWEEYDIGITCPSSAGRMKITLQPTGGSLDVIYPAVFEGDLESYDLTSLASLLLTSQGTPAVQSADDSTLGDIVDGDSFKSATLTMPAGKLSPFGITNIAAGGITVEAAIMLSPSTISYPITATVVSGPSLTFTISWDTQQHPVLASGVYSVPWYIDVQVIKTGPPKQIITTYRLTFNQVWQRDTRTT